MNIKARKWKSLSTTPIFTWPTGHGTVRVVVVVGRELLWSLELESRCQLFWLRSPSFFSPPSCLGWAHGIRGFWANFSLGWDPSRSVRNCQSSCSLTLNFLRGGIRGGSKTGSLRGGIYKYNWIFLRGGIPHYKTGLLLRVRSLTGWVCILVYFFILRFCQCRRSLNKLCFSLKEAQQFEICIGCRIQGYLSGNFFRRGTNETF